MLFKKKREIFRSCPRAGCDAGRDPCQRSPRTSRQSMSSLIAHNNHPQLPFSLNLPRTLAYPSVDHSIISTLRISNAVRPAAIDETSDTSSDDSIIGALYSRKQLFVTTNQQLTAQPCIERKTRRIRKRLLLCAISRL